MIAAILATVESILDPIPPTALMQRISSVFSDVADVLAAIPNILTPVANVFAAISHVLASIAQVFSTIPNQITMNDRSIPSITLRPRHRRRASQHGGRERGQSKIAHRSS